MKPKKKQEIEEFVLHHYQAGKLDTKKALKNVKERLNLEPKPAKIVIFWQSMRRYAAIVVMAVVMVAAYAIFAHQSSADSRQPAPIDAPQPTATAQPVAFHFDDTPINEVFAELSAHYGVNLIAADTTRHLTGDFEADDLQLLLSMIEQALDTEIRTENPQ